MKKVVITALLAAAVLIGLTGCGKKPTDVIFTVGDYSMTREEFLYHVAYFEVCGINEATEKGMSAKAFWDSNNDEGVNNRQYYYTMTYAEASYYAIMAGVAQTVGNISLTDSEMTAADNYAKEYFDLFTEEEIKRSGMTLHGFELAIRRIVLANKYIQILKSEYKVDEDIIRSGMNKSDYKCVKTEWIGLGKTELNAKDKMQKALEKIKAVVSCEDAAKELSDVATFKTGTYHLNSGNKIDEIYSAAANSLEDGEISGIVEGENAYYIIKMIDKDCDSYYEDTVAQIVDEKIEKSLDNYYEQIAYTYSRELKNDALKVEEFGTFCNNAE